MVNKRLIFLNRAALRRNMETSIFDSVTEDSQSLFRKTNHLTFDPKNAIAEGCGSQPCRPSLWTDLVATNTCCSDKLARLTLESLHRRKREPRRMNFPSSFRQRSRDLSNEIS